MAKIMELGIEEARKTMNKNIGGPFGAVITDKYDNIIAVASNTVLRDHDPSAHAEINAIRKAGNILNTHDLTDCKIYATGYPCPMCISAIIWSNISEVYYGTNLFDAEKIGFRDDFIYDYLKGDNKDLIKIINIDRDKCIKLFEEYSEENKQIY